MIKTSHRLLTFLLLGICLFPKPAQTIRPAPIYISYGINRLIFGRDIVAQMTDHSVKIWDIKTWRKLNEFNVGSGDFNSATSLGILSNESLIATGRTGRDEIPDQIYIVPKGMSKPNSQEINFPTSFRDWFGIKIFPDSTSSTRFWMASFDGEIPLSLFELPNQTDATNRALLKRKLVSLKLDGSAINTLTQLQNGSFACVQGSHLKVVDPSLEKVQSFTLNKKISEIWHLAKGPVSNQVWIAFPQLLDSTSFEGAIQLVALQEPVKTITTISVGNAWIHAMDAIQDKIAVLTFHKEPTNSALPWELRIYQKDGTLISTVSNLPFSNFVVQPCAVKLSPDAEQFALLCEGKVWVGKVKNPSRTERNLEIIAL